MKSVKICKAKALDIEKVVSIHLSCFRNSFSSALGKKILSNYYRSYLDNSPDLFLVARCDDSVVGFVTGYCCDDKEAFNSFKKRNRIRIYLRVFLHFCLFDKRVFKKIFCKPGKETVLLPQLDEVRKNKKGDLLSICVLPEYRKNNIATDLEKEFTKELLTKNRDYCILSCLANNFIANNFYEKLGYIL